MKEAIITASRDPRMRHAPFARTEGELRLSNAGQLELLRGVLDRGAAFRTGVRGSSMAPLIRDGDVLTIAPLHGHVPRMGDVVAFATSRGELCVHRIIARTPAGWLIRGDGCPEPDGVVPRESVLGRVARLERNGHVVRGGLGPEAMIVAWLQRVNALPVIMKLVRLPRAIAGACLRRVQGIALFRSLGRRLAFRRVTIEEASDAELVAVHAHINPGNLWEPGPRDAEGGTDFVARLGGGILGFVQFVKYPLEPGSPWAGCWLFSLVVWGQYRGLGLGEKLTRRVIERAVAGRATELSLLVFEDNARAIRLYRKLGFEKTTVPALELVLADEARQLGRRRIVMRRLLRSLS